MNKLLFISTVLMVAMVGAIPPPKNDRIESLPGLDQMPDFDMYSGFLQSKKEKVFYWLNEAVDGESNTLLVWFNGGPGCSSMYGLLKENGPFLLDDETGTLKKNDFSWNRFAHTLYIEVPLGVGFSHLDSKRNVNYTSNDHNMAVTLLKAYETFLSTYPKYQQFDIYFSGESEAGIFVPVAAERLLREQPELATNFKGIILGNPYLSKYLVEKTKPHYAYAHGLIKKSLYDTLDALDCYNADAVISHSSTDQQICKSAVDDFEYVMMSQSINQYNILYKHYMAGWEKMWVLLGEYDALNPASEDYQQEKRRYETIFEQRTGFSEKPLEAYLSRQDVQEAINVGSENAVNWEICNYDVDFEHGRRFTDMKMRIKKILGRYNKSVLLYYGDQDLVCNFLSGDEFVSSLGYEETESRSHIRVYNEDELESTVGSFQDFSTQRLRFAIIKGAGHMAPVDKPEVTFNVVNEWIQSDGQ